MKIAIETFHGPDRLTVRAGQAFDDDHALVKQHPERFADPEVVAARREPRVHGPVQSATARPGEKSSARAAKPRKKTAKADDAAESDSEES